MCMPTNLFCIKNRTGEPRYAFYNADHCNLHERDEAVRRPNWRGRPLLQPSLLQKLDTFKMQPGFYAAVVEDYANFLNWRHPVLAGQKGGFLNYTFPHITTADQSFYNDEFEALVGLGYLQGSALPILKRVSP